MPNFLLAILPALVALTAPAELVLMTVCAVDWVVLLALVALLRHPEDELVMLVLLVRVRLSLPSSYADFRCIAIRCLCELLLLAISEPD